MPPTKLESLFVIPSDDNRRTFGEDEKLPSLPVPDLKHTLSRYLDSLKPFLTAEEYGNSVKLVKSFEEGIGRKLHEKLKKKAENERNWVEKWWEEQAYLQIRLPLIPYCSMDGVMPKNIPYWSYGSEDDQIKHAAIFGYHLTQHWILLRKEELLPTQTADKKVNFSMSQYRRLYNTVRVPGETTDSLVSYFKTAAEGFCPSTVVIMCKGRLFCFNAVDAEGNPENPSQWENVLRRILITCNETKAHSGVGILTCDERSNWSKNRKHLEGISTRNQEILDLIDRCLFVLVMDDSSPETDSDVTNCNICGDYENRWCDKSMSMIFYKNGRSGALCDKSWLRFLGFFDSVLSIPGTQTHTAFDGIVVIACHHYVLTALEESKGEWENNKTRTRPPVFEELRFEIDEVLESEINRLKQQTLEWRKDVLMTRHNFEDYGKSEIQRLKFHPDSFVQMCLQLAYYKIHQKPAPCYETATTRKFYNGRTETLRCCTTQCLEWVLSMMDPQCTNEVRCVLFDRAVKRHDELMSEARENSGCDRHLFGMYCTALEEGIEIPELYLDPSYLKSGGGGNFLLSTSCTGYTPLGGGVAPMCKDGYGIFYNISPNRIYFTISVNTNSSETNAWKFFDSLKGVLRETRQVLLMASRNMSKY